MNTIEQNSSKIICYSSILLILLLNVESFGQISGNDLYKNFQNPPNSAKPRTWWHWTRGNVSLEGITKDLEWMKRVGIAGFQLSDVNFGGGQSTDKKIMFGSDEWYHAVKFATEEAERLDLEMAIFSSPGWSITGGPWVKPKEAMKKLVWSDTVIVGSDNQFIKLPQPPSNNGPFQDYGADRKKNDPRFYKNIAVFAYKLSNESNNIFELNPEVTSSSGNVDKQILFDEKYSSSVIIKPSKNNDTAWIEYEFKKPFTARSFTISGGKGIPVGKLLISDDGVDYSSILELPGAQLYRQGWVRTFSIPETSAKYYRIEFTGKSLNPKETMMQTKIEPGEEYIIREAKLSSETRINRWEEKAGFRHLFEYESVSIKNDYTDFYYQNNQIINLSSKLDSNGNLHWDAPKGKWKILRMGYSLTGAKNRPPVPSGLGYEVDKLSREHTETYLANYLTPIKDKLGSLYGNRLSHVLLDSWEAGMQNWTDDMIDEFKYRRGYDPTNYLPALAGRIVKNSEVSDRFLWDFRRTLADMFAENHYGVISNYLHKEGIKTYGEASGVSLEILEDALLSKKFMDIPMGEFWVRDLHPSSMYYEDIRGAASAAHVYGKNIVAAEAYTGGGYESPFKLKKIADYWFCQGVNRLVFHTSAHQLNEDKPGNTMVGTHLNRNITWAEQAKQFMNYLSRTSFMLQQGKYVADIAYLLNEGAPSTMPIWGDGLTPELPEGYSFDYINSDVLLNRISVNKTGELILPDGMSYNILVLPQIDKMTLPVLEKIKNLVQNGATIVGPKPNASPSLVDYPLIDEKVNQIASEIWGDLNGISRNRRTFGNGNVYWGFSLEYILNSLNIPPDLEYSKPLDTELYWVHRRTENKDIFFVVNSSKIPQKLDIRFRVNGKIPKIWDIDSGTRKSVNYKIQDMLTTVTLKLPEFGSTFLVFDNEDSESLNYQKYDQKELVKLIDGKWELSFQENMGAPNKIDLDELLPWSYFTEEGIKYFSGTASYNKTFFVDNKSMFEGSNFTLDLGKVNDLATVTINGNEVGNCWKPPYVFDISEYIIAGENNLKIDVTNQWTNRLLGDSHEEIKIKVLKESGKSIHFFGPKPSLPESGLIGPVNLILKK